MRKKLYTIILFLLVITSEIIFGKETNKTKLHKINKNHNHIKEKSDIDRIKRSLDNEDDKPFWGNRGKKKIQTSNLRNRYDDTMEKALKRSADYDKDPFWGMRGRRESASAENYMDDENLEYSEDHSSCKNCYGTINYGNNDKNFKNRREEILEPFWGNRGRRNSDKKEEPDEPFWGNRGRRQDNEPFWGTRGRRKDSLPWGARERREDEPFWGNRGRRDDEPFWGNRGKKQDFEPFWGNRGRRQDYEPFWGNRGRRDDEPFWDNREKQRERESFWSNPGTRKENLKESIMNAINHVQNNIEHLSRLRRSDTSSFWSNRGRNSQLKYLFSNPARNKLSLQQMGRDFNMDVKAEPSTVHDSRIFADEPQYIVVERSGRSSAEVEDPFYISRGKKYYVNYNLIKAARDRRGAIEEIVKSVRNDPYYIARGKKNIDVSTAVQSKINSTSEDEVLKAKELICSAIDLVTSVQNNGKVKREINSDRNRRTILKNLAAQLQIDPYYVSRGKKSNVHPNRDNLLEFIAEVAEKCD